MGGSGTFKPFKVTLYCQPEAANKTFERCGVIACLHEAGSTDVEIYRCTSCNFLRHGSHVTADP